MLSYEEDQGIPSNAHYIALKLEVSNNPSKQRENPKFEKCLLQMYKTEKSAKQSIFLNAAASEEPKYNPNTLVEDNFTQSLHVFCRVVQV